ncbi:MAG: DMT family transporter [bacterium]|nr:DMT family transporter [bacterium]
MNWQSFLLISILFSSVIGLFHRVLMKEENSDAKAQTIVFLGLIGVFTFTISIFRGLSFPQFPLLLPNFILIIILGTLAPLFTFRAFQLIDTAEVGILLSSQRLWTVLAALIFLGETLTISKTFGIILILIGVAIISWKKHKIKIGKGEFYAILSAFLYGIFYVNAFYILQHMDAISFEVYASLLPAFSLLLIQPGTIKKIRFYFVPKNAARILIAVILDIIATVSLYIAYQLGRNASQIAPLSATPIIFTTILAAIFLNERENLKNKIIGAIVVIAGAILVI